MQNRLSFVFAAFMLGAPVVVATAPHGATPEALYAQYCASCHGATRLGGMGPALLPENLKRVRREDAISVVTEGRVATQMPAFGAQLSSGQIEALVQFIYSPLPEVPQWTMAAIRASHTVDRATAGESARPLFEADPLNLFLVVELGDHHATVLDGDRLEPIHRFATPIALHGGPKYSPDGRYVFLASRDGWIWKYDLYRLQRIAEIRAGINTRNLAVSGDGRYVIVGNYLPHSLVILDADDLSPLQVIAVADESGQTSRVSAVYAAPPRESFVIALKDLKEVWEISYADEPPYYGKVHDYRYEGPPVQSERFPIRRIRLGDYLDDFFFDPPYHHLIGAARDGNNGQVVNLLVGRKIADVDLPGLPHLGSGITWRYQGRTVLATPHLKESAVSIIDLQTWTTIKRIKTLGPGFFMRSHEHTPYAWVDVFFGPNRDAVHVIDKNSLEIVRTLRPVPDKTAAHVEFDRYGRYALLSIWEDDGALVVYDAATLKVHKRIPMKKPSGKYNVYNKIRGSAGTSH